MLEKEIWGNTLEEWGISILIIIVTIIITKLVSLFNKKVVKPFTRKTTNKLDDIIYDAIESPVSILRDKTVGQALAMMAEYKIGGIPVVDTNNRLVGIVTNRDLRFRRDMNELIDDVMTKENIITTRQTTDLEAAADILQQHKIEKLPVVDADNKLIGLITYKDITKAKDKPLASKDKDGRLRVAAGILAIVLYPGTYFKCGFRQIVTREP